MNIIGHDALMKRFANAQQRGQLPHAWLIHGPRGIGKRMLAMHFAGRLLCETESACGACAACRQLASGAHPDCVITEREPNRRDLRIDLLRAGMARITLASAGGQRRVWVIDDACTMNLQAANALLKKLEEPPADVFVFLVAHDAARLPATVRSRCVLLPAAPLRPPQSEQVLRMLGAHEEDLTFLQELIDGRPGIAAAIAADRQAVQALADWRSWCAQPKQADLAKVHAWIRQHAARLPPELIARAALMDWRRRRRLLPDEAQAVQAIASWPEEVRRYALRPAFSLFVRFLRLRMAC